MAKEKKNPYRFELHFNPEDPIQKKAAEILCTQRCRKNVTRYITEAIVVSSQMQHDLSDWVAIQYRFLMTDEAELSNAIPVNLSYAPPRMEPINEGESLTPKKAPKDLKPVANEENISREEDAQPVMQESASIDDAPATEPDIEKDNEFSITFDSEIDESISGEEMDEFVIGMSAFG